MDNHYREQTIGATVSIINEKRISELVRQNEKINLEEKALITKQDEAMKSALEETKKIRDHLGSPENIIGREGVGNLRCPFRQKSSLCNQVSREISLHLAGKSSPDPYPGYAKNEGSPP